jgi:cell wall-associated NlpC family hydrolase
MSILRRVRRRSVIAGALTGALLAGGAGYVAVAQGGSDAAPLQPAKASIEDWRWAPRDELPAAPKAKARDGGPKERPSIDQVPTETTPQQRAEAPEPETTEEEPARVPERDPVPDRPASAPGDLDLSGGGSNGSDNALVKAEVLKNGVALPPLEAPPEVRAIFEAGNTIARSPYKWGGGHGKWQDTGYDCSGSVSYALAAAGLVNASMPSGGYMNWGKPGKGKWITLYTNPDHIFMVVAGVRFDTVARGQTGSRWINSMTSTRGYVARHPPGF